MKSLLDGGSWSIIYWSKWRGLFFRRRAIMAIWNGKPSGPATFFHRNGRISCRGHYMQSRSGETVMTGHWEFFSERGKPLGYCQYDGEGRRHGVYEQVTDKGVLVAKGMYDRNKPKGRWLLYHLHVRGCLPVETEGITAEQWQKQLEFAYGEANLGINGKRKVKGD